MKDIRDLEVWNFPDGHKHLKLKNEEFDLREISISIKSFDDLFVLAQLNSLVPVEKLRINYLLGARCDRQFSTFEAFDLKIIANFINNLGFEQVEILKPHSQVSLDLIKNSKKITVTSELLIQCLTDNNITDYSIVAPDKGASAWIEEELGRTDIVKCVKIRENGVIKSVTFEGEVKETCIIVDDLIDGGKTFTELSKELKIKGAKDVYLIVTHGIFSQGFSELEKSLKMIYCTNSFKDKEDIYLDFGHISYIREANFVEDRLKIMKIC